jgi:uncharacterized membrane protein YcaP (DUF421 family)
VFADILTYVEIVIRTLIIYFVVLVGLRATGKRQLGQMTPLDLVLLLLISNAVQNAMTGPDTSLLGGIVSALTLLAAHSLFSRLRVRVPALRKALVGEPTPLIRDGQVLADNVKQEEITEDELLSALREHGVEDICDVELAELEVDGSISVVPADSAHIRGRRRAVRFIKSGQ